MSQMGSIADIPGLGPRVRFTLESGHPGFMSTHPGDRLFAFDRRRTLELPHAVFARSMVGSRWLP